MEYGQIIKHCLRTVQKTRTLWYLGILALFTEGAGSLSGLSNFSSFSSHDSKKMHGEDISSAGIDHSLNWLHSHLTIVVIFLCIVLATTILLVLISLSAKAALILAFSESSEPKPISSFKHLFGSGKKFALKLLALRFFLLFLALLPLVLLVLLILILILAIPHSLILAVIIGISVCIFTLLYLVFLSFYLPVISHFSECSLVLSHTKILSSIKAAHHLIMEQKTNSLITLGISIGIGIIFSLTIISASLLFLLATVPAGYLIFTQSTWLATLLYGSSVGIVFFAAYLMLTGVFTAFYTGFWTLSFRALSYLTIH